MSDDSHGSPRSGSELRAALAQARLMLLFTPGACARDPLAVLEATLPEVDIVQVRPKSPGLEATTAAAEALLWTERVLEHALALGEDGPLVLVNDRIDVALALREHGAAGVHVGQDDCPVSVARAELGAAALIGVSTHDAQQLVRAEEEGADYVGFGPVFATPTKGYEQGLGPERAWVAASAAGIPLFAIGGVCSENADQLATVGRAAVGAAILGSRDPGRAARELRASLSSR